MSGGAVLQWPYKTLVPGNIAPTKVPVTRGARGLAGVSRAFRTDRGYWRIAYQNVTLDDERKRRLWNAIGTELGGMSGLIEIPVWSYDSAPWPEGSPRRYLTVPHEGGIPFAEGMLYRQRNICIDMEEDAAIGATVVTLRRLRAAERLAGIRFSYFGALYETGVPIEYDGDLWRLPIFPAVRAPIPAGAELECDLPTCIVNLATDGEMAAGLSASEQDQASVSFVEAHHYWSDLALAA